MSKWRKLCPFRKVVERETDGMTGKTVEWERFQHCVEKKCMAYVYIGPIHIRKHAVNHSLDATGNWGCARMLNGGAANGN